MPSSLDQPVASFLARCLAAAGAAQAVAAIIFFFAANWWTLATVGKIAILDLLLLACAGAAAWALPGSFARTAWAVAGAVLSGVLFGVHGQIWQTGADAWELFALWTGFAALWAILARADAVWALAAGLGMIALTQWGANAAPSDLLPLTWLLPLLALAPAAVGLAARLCGAGGSGWLWPLLLAAGAGALGLGGVVALGEDLGPLALGLVLSVAVMALARPRRFGPWPFAIALVLAVVLAEALATHYLTEGRGVTRGLRMLAVALLLLAGLAAIAFVLRRLFPLGDGASVGLHRLLSVGIGVGAWIAAGLAVSGVGALADVLVGNDTGPLAAAFAALAVALALSIKRDGAGPFRHHVQAAFAFIAYGAAVAEVGIRTDALGGAVLAAAAFLVPLAALTRSAAAVVPAIILILGLAGVWLYGKEPWLVAVLAGLLVVPGWLSLGLARPSLRAGGICLLVAAFMVPGAVEFADPSLGWVCRGSAALAAAALMAAALYCRRDLVRPRLLAAGALVLAGSLMVPAGGAGLVGLSAAASRAAGRLLTVLAFAAAAWSVVRFYYLLEMPLGRKAAWLAVGAVLTALAWLSVVIRSPGPAVPRRASALLMLLGAVGPMLLEAWDGMDKAAVVAEGRQVLLPLRPVDPRSLIQGDYMALRYGAELTAALPARGGPVVLGVDGRGVAVTIRPGADAVGENEVLVHVRPGRDKARLAPVSFLFPEGQGTVLQQARYAVVRVRDGALVLTGLADADGRAITPMPR